MIRHHFDDASAFAAAHCCSETQVVPHGRMWDSLALSMARVGDAVIQLKVIRSAVTIQEKLHPDRVQIAWPISRQLSLCIDGRPVRWGEVMFVWPSSLYVAVARSAARLLTITVPHTPFAERCAAVLGEGAGIGRDPCLYLPSPASFSRAYDAVSVLYHFASRYPELAERPGLVRVIHGTVLDALVGLLLNPKAQHAIGHSRVVARVIESVQALLSEGEDDEVTVSRLTSDLSISERTLRAVFGRVYGTSPARYLRSSRLQRVRQALRRADPVHASVATLAADHGFRDFGRFAREYHQMFGEYPSQTLRKS